MSQPYERFLKASGVQIPIICGAMYPCSNLELVAAVSEAGGLGIVQPLSATYVYNYEFRAALQAIKKLTSKPFGMNALIEQSSKRYEDTMRAWIDIALEEGCRFFVTALANPRWVVDRVAPAGGVVYHDATRRRWGEKARDAGVAGLIAVNKNAGGHAGEISPEELLAELLPLGLPVVAAGGVGDAAEFIRLMKMGYAGVQMGTRFIATTESRAHDSYKQAIVAANAADIVLTERVTGIPLSVIRTPLVDRVGTKISALSKILFRLESTKRLMRLWYGLRGMRSMRRGALSGTSTKDFWQAGKSVAGISSVVSAREVVEGFWREYREGSNGK